MTDTHRCSIDLAARGYALAPAEEIANVRRRLGGIHLEASVEVVPGSTKMISSTAAIPFHNDHPNVDYMSLCCERTSSSSGDTFLLDTAAVIDALPDPVKRTLLNVPVGVPQSPLDELASPSLKKRSDLVPALTTDGGTLRLYWVPWMVQDAAHPVVLDAMAGVYRVLRTLAATALRIRWTPGLGVIFDNRRMLHARATLEGNTARLLRRTWIVGTRRGDHDG